MSGKNNLQRQIQSYIILALLVISSLTVMFYLGNMYPFGGRSNLAVDLGTQYSDFILFFKNASLQDFLYSFTKGFGGPTLGLAAYYMFSPFNFIAYFFDDSQIQLAVTVIIYAKFIFIGLCANYYLLQHYKKYTIPFALMYTLCPYFVMYYFNIIWLDAFAVLPILVLGCEKIIDKGKIGFFTVIFTVSLIMNYYISYMSSIFIALYFFYYYFSNYKLDFKTLAGKLRLMIKSVLISVFISAPVLVPTFLDLQGNKMQEQGVLGAALLQPDRMFNPLLVFSNIFSGNYLVDTAPFIFFTLSCAILLIAYFSSTAHTKKEKILSFSFIAVMFISFIYNFLYVIWHAMTYPQGFYFRFYFTYIFLLIVIIRKGFEVIDKINFKYFSIGTALMVGASYLFYFLNPHLPWGMHTILFTTCFLIGLLVCIYLNYKKVKYFKLLLSLVILLNVMFDGIFIFLAYTQNGYVFYYEPLYKPEYDITAPVVEHIEDDSFYRMEDLSSRPYNQPMAFDYYGLSHFSSTFDPLAKQAFVYFGYDNTYYSQQYNKSMLEVDSFFAVKYLMAFNDVDVSSSYNEIFNTDSKALYQNPYAFPIIYTANNNMPGLQPTKEETLDMIFKHLGAINDLYSEDGELDVSALQTASTTAQNNEVNITFQDANVIRFDVTASANESVYATIPYDTSWYIFRNGERIEPDKFVEYFISLELVDGHNEFYMIYIPRGMMVGGALFVVGVSVVGFDIIKKRRRGKEIKALES